MQWTATKNVAWKRSIPGTGWSSPIIHAGRIYLTTAVPVEGSRNGDHSLRAMCLDAKTGKPVWDREVFRQDGSPAESINRKERHAIPPPLTAGQGLYAHFGHKGPACLDLDGKVLWKNTSLSYEPVHGNGGTPILVDDKLIFSGDGYD